MSRERHYNKGWSSSSSRQRSRSPPYRRRYSRSPIRDKYSNRNRIRNDRNVREDTRLDQQRREEIEFQLRKEQDEVIRRRVEIQKEQLEIQIREDARQRELIKRREEEIDIQLKADEREKEIKRIEEQIEQQLREDAIKKELKKMEDEKKKKEIEEQTNTLVEEDLRLMLEKNRTFHGVTPPLVIPSNNTVMQATNAQPMIIKNTSIAGPENVSKIPGFDYSRLGSEPANETEKITCSKTSNADEIADKSCEGRVKYFTKDCDTVALVTQLLIEQDPSLEESLVKAMRGVLQKVMQKHLEVIQM